MITIQKPTERDLVILNLTDPQLSSNEWAEGEFGGKLLEHTLRELVERTKPDLITVCGDIAWAHAMDSYERFASLVDSFGIPWAPVFGNHDNQEGYEHVCKIADILTSKEHCLLERGPRELGCGNYIIRIVDDGRPVTALFMLDSHDCRPPLPHEGNVREIWDELLPEQIDWYKNEAEKLKSEGFGDSAIILHIPIYAYRDAYNAAAKEGLPYCSYKPQECIGGEFWNEGYEDTFGVNYEGICSHPYDNGFFEVIKELNFTTHVLCGHDHVNNSSISYRGVRLSYVTKLGIGCYYDPRMNGGTVMTVGKNGIDKLYHEYVSCTDI